MSLPQSYFLASGLEVLPYIGPKGEDDTRVTVLLARMQPGRTGSLAAPTHLHISLKTTAQASGTSRLPCGVPCASGQLWH